MCYALNESIEWGSPINTNVEVKMLVVPTRDAKLADATQKEDASGKRPADEVLQHEVVKAVKLSPSEDVCAVEDGGKRNTVAQAEAGIQMSGEGTVEEMDTRGDEHAGVAGDGVVSETECEVKEKETVKKAKEPVAEKAVIATNAVATKTATKPQPEMPKRGQRVVAAGHRANKKKPATSTVEDDNQDGEDDGDREEEEDASDSEEHEDESEDDNESTPQPKTRKVDIIKAEAAARKQVRAKMQAEKNQKVDELHKKHRKEMADAKKKMEGLKAKHEEQMKEKDNKHRNKIDELKLRAEDAEEECKTTRAETNEALRKAKEEYTSTLRTTKAEHTRVTRNMKAKHAAEVKELKPEFSEAMRLKDELLRDKQKEITKLFSSQRKMVEKNDFFDQTMSSSQAKTTQYEKEIVRGRHELKVLYAAWEERDKKMEKERAEARAALERAASRFDIQQNQARTLEGTLAQVQRNEYARAKGLELKIEEIGVLRKRIVALETENAGLKAQKDHSAAVKEEGMESDGDVQRCVDDIEAGPVVPEASNEEEKDRVE